MMQITTGPEAVTTTRVIDIKAEFDDPLLLGKKRTFRKRVRFVNGKTKSLTYLESQIFDSMSYVYERKIGNGWRTYDLPDRYTELSWASQVLVGQAKIDKNQLAVDRIDKVATVAGEVAKQIRATLGIGKSHMDLIVSCLNDS